MARLGIADRADLGPGYDREAVRLPLDYAGRYRNLERVWLWVHPRNERAIDAYRACGFVEEGRLRRIVWKGGAFDGANILGIALRLARRPDSARERCGRR